MKVTNPLFLFVVGALALAAGFLTSRMVREEVLLEPAKVQRGVVATGLQKEEAIHPDLLKLFRELGRGEEASEDRVVGELEAEDFPDAFMRGFESQADTVKLLQRWGEVDLDGMIDFFLNRGSLTMRHGAYSIHQFGNMVLRLLAERDPLEAWEYSKRFPREEGTRQMALRFIGEKDPDLAIKLALENLDGFINRNFSYSSRGSIDLGGKLNKRMALELARREPFGANEIAFLSELSLGRKPGKMLAGIWVELTPDQRRRTAISLIPALDDGSETAGEMFRAIRESFVAGEMANSKYATRFFNVFGERLLEEDGLEGAMAWTKQHFESIYSGSALTTLLRKAQESGSPVAEILEAMEPNDPSMRYLVGNVASILHQKDEEGALRWVAGLESDGNAAQAARSLAERYASKPDKEMIAAASLLGEASGPFLLAISAKRIARLGTEGAIEWAQSLPGEHAGEATVQVVRQWAGQEPTEAWAFVESVPRDDLRRAEMVQAAALNLWNRPVAERAEWISGLDASDRQAARRVVEHSWNNREWREERLAELDQ